MFPASGKTTLANAWNMITGTASNVRKHATSLTLASSISRMACLDLANSLSSYLATLDTYAATPGLATYAKNELNDPAIDIAAEFMVMRVQIVATQDWIVANFPKDASNNLPVYAFSGTMYVDVMLTAPEMAAFKTQLGALIATIN